MPKILWSSNSTGWFYGELRRPAYSGDAGLDMVVVSDATLAVTGVTQLDCGINIALPEKLVAVPIVRSSFAKLGVMVVTTLIDNGYRGPLFLFCINLSGREIRIPAGTRVGQLLLLHNYADGIDLEEVVNLPESERGTKGFGSSGGHIEKAE